MAAALGSTGCAAVFRESKPPVRFESEPAGAAASVTGHSGPMPLEVPVPRSGLTEVRVTMDGFEEHRGLVRKRINGWWLTADLATCILPVMLCIPLLVDAISGAWVDVDKRYRARLVPLRLASAPPYRPEGTIYVVRPNGSEPAPAPAPATAPKPATPALAEASTLSESERKASARAEYQDGVELQAQKKYDEALARFQLAQKFYDAPTHLLHIAQCLAATGKLVEAQENYEALTHKELQGNAPEPFRDAVVAGRRELAELRPRIPTLRIEVKPAPSTLRNLVLLLDGKPLPNEVIGIARPVNPGTYRATATAWGIAASVPVSITLAEKDVGTLNVKLGR
jgi:hypothetical protein